MNNRYPTAVSGNNSVNHQPRKRFGQNFLHDPGVIRRILAAVDARPGQHLLEIGPGQGAITAGLLAAAGELDAVEIDRDLYADLSSRFAGQNLHLYNVDALKFDFRQLADDGRSLRVVGNLPYNISTPLLFHLLDQSDAIQDMHFMLQKEVVDRMAAAPGLQDLRSTLGGLAGAVLGYPPVRYRSGRLPPGSQGNVRLRAAGTARSSRATRSPTADVFDEVLIHAFGQRRKTLRNALKGLLSSDEMTHLGIDPGLRAERIDVAGFVAMANLVAANRTDDGEKQEQSDQTCNPANQP